MNTQSFRNPPAKIRIALVAVVYAFYGIILGLILTLFLGSIWLFVPLSTLLFATLGAKVEATSAKASKQKSCSQFTYDRSASQSR